MITTASTMCFNPSTIFPITLDQKIAMIRQLTENKLETLFEYKEFMYENDYLFSCNQTKQNFDVVVEYSKRLIICSKPHYVNLPGNGNYDVSEMRLKSLTEDVDESLKECLRWRHFIDDYEKDFDGKKHIWGYPLDCNPFGIEGFNGSVGEGEMWEEKDDCRFYHVQVVDGKLVPVHYL